MVIDVLQRRAARVKTLCDPRTEPPGRRARRCRSDRRLGRVAAVRRSCPLRPTGTRDSSRAVIRTTVSWDESVDPTSSRPSRSTASVAPGVEHTPLPTRLHIETKDVKDLPGWVDTNQQKKLWDSFEDDYDEANKLRAKPSSNHSYLWRRSRPTTSRCGIPCGSTTTRVARVMSKLEMNRSI